jgi:hypothetical protein
MYIYMPQCRLSEAKSTYDPVKPISGLFPKGSSQILVIFLHML